MIYKTLWTVSVFAALFVGPAVSVNTASAQPAVGVYAPIGPSAVAYRRPYYRATYRRAYSRPYARPYYNRAYRYW
jgi:hypothetical protein